MGRLMSLSKVLVLISSKVKLIALPMALIHAAIEDVVSKLSLADVEAMVSPKPSTRTCTSPTRTCT